ncbi:hypothetical protein PY650_34425 [Rhizobium calliandrae]|uniref:J domain-containing protein n=1 Tax=Rhizobium calliandrae TaxID=1312182 RepID=A0ABT7KRC7_9HYPH|nr:hypothetical protein [Rhizobium calliandrae]MDL2410585.1 hypothetical protein [Rhizobium calliandrae]
MLETCWTLLQIAPTHDEDDIRRAYARRLRHFRPDEDPQGFQRLVGARDAALAWANAQTANQILLHTINDQDGLREEIDASDINLIDATRAPLGSPAENENARPPANSTPPANSNESGPSRKLSIDPAHQPETIGREHDELVFDRLNDIIAQGKQRSWSVDPAAQEIQPWVALFDLAAANLSLLHHEAFLEAVGQYVASMLPGSALQSHDTVHEFAQGHSFAAVVETVEEQCRFAERPAKLVHLCGQQAAMLYFSWLAHAQVARGILQRRAAGRVAYFDEKTGLPNFPNEDRTVALQTVQRAKFFNEAVEHKRWPSRFDWKSLIVPTTRSASAGLFWQSGILFALMSLIAAGSFLPISNIVPWIGLASIVVLLVTRIILAFHIDRLAILAAVQRVIDADRRGLWNKVPRSDYLRNRWRDFEKLINTAEVIFSVMMVIAVLTMLSPLRQTKIDPAKPVEAVVSEVISSSLEAMANDDQLPDSQLVDLMKFVISSEQAGFRGSGKDADLLVRDLPNLQWLNELHDRANQLLGGSWFRRSDGLSMRQFMAMPAAEREKKLHRLAEAYRSGSPQQRMQIERSLVSWAPVLQGASDPQTISAIWAAIPPQTIGPNLDAFPEAFRRLLLDGFLRIAAFDSKANDVQLMVQFNWLLTAPDEVLRYIGPTTPPDPYLSSLKGGHGDQNGNATNGLPAISMDPSAEEGTAAARYLRQNPGHPSATASRLNQPASTEASIARLGYFNIIRTCLDLTKAKDRMHMRSFIAHSIADPLPADISTNADLWRTFGQRALAEPMCSRKVLANGMGGKETDDLFKAPREQLSELVNADLSLSERDFIEDFLEFMPEDKSVFAYTGARLASLAHGLLGKWYFRNKDYYSAVLEFDQALGGYAQCSEFRMRRGQALEALGDHKRGRADLQLIAQPSTTWCSADPKTAQEFQLAIKAQLAK